jgi:NarL family two-component system sensor histidine kinase YdfH
MVMLEESHRMKELYQPRLLRWFILLWMGLVYIWGLQVQGGRDDGLTTSALILFTVLMVVHTGVHWMYLSGLLARLQQMGLLLVCVIQGILALGIGLVVRNWDVSISLYLTLLLEASTFPVKTRFIAMGSYLLFFALNVISLSIVRPHELLEAIRNIVAPVSLFAVGYTVLYMQQVRAREQAQKLLRDLEVAHAQLSAYALHVEELTLAAERQRIARELHDTLVQGLAGLTMQLEVANLRLTNQRYEQAQTTIKQAMERTRATLAEARHAIYDLRLDAEPEHNLVITVQEEIEHFTEDSTVECTVDIEALSSAPPSLHMHVLRMIAEGLTNVAHHAQAQHVWVSATYEHSGKDKSLLIEVRDDGKGFDPEVAAREVGHYGLIGLRERARLLGGKLEILSKPGKGTTLQLRIPQEEEALVHE